MQWVENTKSGIIVALVVALIGLALNERAKILDITYQNDKRIGVLEAWRAAFQDYPWSRKDLQESIVNSFEKAIDPRLKRIEDRLLEIERAQKVAK